MQRQLLRDEVAIKVERLVRQRREHHRDRARLHEDERGAIGARR